MDFDSKIKETLDHYYLKYNNREFINDDPVSIPHKFTKKQDIEIAGLFASVIAWGRRSMIINNANRIMHMMDNSPHDFIINHLEKDRNRFQNFKHRTFQPDDMLYFLEFLQWYYRQNDSLENAFLIDQKPTEFDMAKALAGFHNIFFSLENAPARTRKHIPTPLRKSTCKRLNMFLRWMVRKDDFGVDFGIWNNIPVSELMIPIDVHVERVARRLGLLTRKQRDWNSVIELTGNLRRYDPKDPVKYDFALFGIGVMEGKPEI